MGVSVCGGCNPSIVVIRWTAQVWEWSSSSNPQITESQTLLGWKRPPRSLSASIDPLVPSLPLTPAPQCHIHMCFELFQGWTTPRMVEQPPSLREWASKQEPGFSCSQTLSGDGGSSWNRGLRNLQLQAVAMRWVLRVLCAVVAVTSSWVHRWPHQDADGSFATWGLRVHLAPRLQSPLYRCFTCLPGDMGKAALETDVLG